MLKVRPKSLWPSGFESRCPADTAQSQRYQCQRRGESRHQDRIQTVERTLYHAVVHVQSLHLLQVVVVADEQHTVTGRDTEQRNETDNCRNAYFAGRDDKGKNAADQCQGQVQQDHAGLLDTAEFVVKQQENNDNTHERCQRQYTAGSLFAFELSAILDVVAFGQLDSGVYLLLISFTTLRRSRSATLAEITIFRFTFSRLIVFGPMEEPLPPRSSEELCVRRWCRP